LVRRAKKTRARFSNRKTGKPKKATEKATEGKRNK
jgi:hypothetical protein